MAGKQRHYFPGNNTPKGFYSYYHHILSQQEADKIFCLKGGPGVGKSTFMRKIGESFLKEGYDVDFLHCSSDSDSLDGFVLKEKKIAMIDATSPHMIDPIHPGAVDTIIHLGDYWDEEGIRQNRDNVLKSSAKLRASFARAYNYLGAAGKMYDNIAAIYEGALKKEELYKAGASIINKELIHKELSRDVGVMKKFFASGITPKGFINYIDTLIEGYRKVYVIKAPVGVSGQKLMELFAESAQYRGFDVEAYYCPLNPESKLEHLLIPQLSVAFVTSNRYHITDESKIDGDVTVISMADMVDESKCELEKHIAEDSFLKMEELLKKAHQCLKEAKAEHDVLEDNYIPNMDFMKIEALRQKTEDAIRRRLNQ